MEKADNAKNKDSMNITVNGAHIRLVFDSKHNPKLPVFIKETLLSAYLMKASV